MSQNRRLLQSTGAALGKTPHPNLSGLIFWMVVGFVAVSSAQAADKIAELPFCRSVDSVWARYYLDHYRHGERANERLHSAIDEALHSISSSLPDNQELARLTRRFSPDFATLVLYDRAVSDECSRHFRVVYEKVLQGEEPTPSTFHASTSSGSTLPVMISSARSKTVLLLVPGLFYRSVTETGANLATQRRKLEQRGWKTDMVYTRENGRIECNARIVARAVEKHKQLGNDLILISVSKGGPEVATALGTILPPDETQHVRVWLNVCGVLRGTQIADEAASKRLISRIGLRLMAGSGDLTGTMSMMTRRSQQRFAKVSLPNHIQVVNYVGLPLSCHIDSDTERGYRFLKDFGPNDGRSVLRDQIVDGMPVVFDFGKDHYFHASKIRSDPVPFIHALIAYENIVSGHRNLIP